MCKITEMPIRTMRQGDDAGHGVICECGVTWDNTYGLQETPTQRRILA